MADKKFKIEMASIDRLADKWLNKPINRHLCETLVRRKPLTNDEQKAFKNMFKEGFIKGRFTELTK